MSKKQIKEKRIKIDFSDFSPPKTGKWTFAGNEYFPIYLYSSYFTDTLSKDLLKRTNRKRRFKRLPLKITK